ncbi:MAG: selenocysteine-specific translation elongation factor, partial [Rhodoblastus sp.]|nr:selenocysteine-specific translation elongation factor [Rhodoblastus sp.]
MIVGTAGHIDHGKSSLVRALTGVDTDRLKEEKARGISIDLGFAYAPAPDGSVLGFVDVPGHEKFVHTMLAGATGVDFVLLVVAADDGIMPQTREHLAILDMLGLERGTVALTKCDMVAPERIAEVSAEIDNLLASSQLAGAEVMPVSSVTGAGVEHLRQRLFEASAVTAARTGEGGFRFAVDRSFTLSGAGTVVTGIVLSGEVAIGDRVVVSPSGRAARVRSIHAQNRAAERGRAGERCALNLSGDNISKDAIARGDFVLTPELHAPTDRIDVSFRLLASEKKPIGQWTPLRLHHAASDVAARLVLLGDDPIAPGDEVFAQLVLEKPIAAAVGDRFVA